MKLFKYISIDDDDIQNVIGSILEDNLIKFTQVKDFNDPFESRPNIRALANDEFVSHHMEDNFESLLSKQYQEYIAKNQPIAFDEFRNFANSKKNEIFTQIKNIIQNNIVKNSLKKTMYDKYNESIGILSLTTKNDNLLMWAHYANSHKGFVVEFDFENEFFNQKLDNKNFLGYLKKVQYSIDRPTDYLVNLDMDIFLTKSIDWVYEDEYRMFMPLKKAEKINQNIYLFKFPLIMIKSIYMGCNISYNNKNKIMKIISNHRFANIDLYESSISEKYYKLDLKKL